MSSAHRKKVCTTVYLDPEQIGELRNLSAATSVPMATLIRSGIDMVLKEGREQLARQQEGWKHA